MDAEFNSLNLSAASSIRPSVRRLLWVAVGVCLFGIVMYGLYWQRSHKTFLTTQSPGNTYLVNLKGEKGRPVLIPNEVRADVYKMGKMFQSDIWFHKTGDSFDLSFEAGFPNHRWLRENVIEFYRSEYFDKGADGLEVRNEGSRPIKYLRVQSINKFLIFDLEQGTSVSLEVPSPRGDSQWIALEGSFTDNHTIDFRSKSFDRRSNQRQRFSYRIVVNDTASVIEMR